jgi:hypothetical protein
MRVKSPQCSHLFTFRTVCEALNGFAVKRKPHAERAGSARKQVRKYSMAEIDTSTDASAIAAKATADAAAAKATADAAAAALAAAPVYDEKQQAHFNKTINETYAKAFEKASGLLNPQIKALEDKIAALAPKPDAAAVAAKAAADAAAAAAASGDKSHEEVARLNAPHRAAGDRRREQA